MSSLTQNYLTLTVEGASIDDLTKGLQAAFAVFCASDVSPHAAARAVFDMEGVSVSHGDPKALVEKLGMAAKASLWFDAEDAAFAACCGGWPEVPEGAELTVGSSGQWARGSQAFLHQ